MKNKLITTVAGLAVIYGCGKSGGEKQSNAEVDLQTKVDGDQAIIHQLSDPDKLNPVTSQGATSSDIESYMFESLLTQQKFKPYDLIPQLAEEMPEISADKLTYTFKIRKNAYFQDGKPVTAHDCLFTLKAIKNPFVDDAPLRNYYNDAKSATVIDENTISYNCGKVYFKNDAFLGGTVLPSNYYDPEGLTKLYSFEDIENYYKELGKTDQSKLEAKPAVAAMKKFAERMNSKELDRAPMGSGPYKFESWEQGDKIVLVKDPNYWQKQNPDYKVCLDKVIFKVINDQEVAIVNLKAEKIDFITGIKPIQYTKQLDTPKFKENFDKADFFLPYYYYLGWNNLSPIFKDVKVRKAMTYLTDRQLIIDNVMFGMGKVCNGPIYFEMPECDTTLTTIPYSMEKGKQLLAEAGWKDTDSDGILDKVIDGKKVDFKFSFLTNQGNDVRKNLAIILADTYKKAGISADVRTLEWAVFLDKVDSHDFDCTILGWVGEVTRPDPYQIWHSTQAANKGSNHISWNDKRTDELLELNRVELDPEKRKALMKEFQQILYDNQPYTFLFWYKERVAIQKRFQGVEWYPVRPGYDATKWWVPTPLQKYKSDLAAN
ncbi:hypothetical protein IT568_10395 [bacterium]|nr:hypothetical protein [bacterium]